jgi:endonuclease-3
VDELIATVLSQNTTDKNSQKAFRILKKRFRSWEDLRKTPERKVTSLIRSAGLANIKAKRIKEIVGEIKRREGAIDLSRLKAMDVARAMEYLTSLKGVGPKTASCVLLFTLGKPAMPVDTHIYRVSRRLGLIGHNVSIEEAHKILTELVPKPLIYNFHLGIIWHGRRTCRAQNPRCGECVLCYMCKSPDKRKFAHK